MLLTLFLFEPPKGFFADCVIGMFQYKKLNLKDKIWLNLNEIIIVIKTL